MDDKQLIAIMAAIISTQPELQRYGVSYVNCVKEARILLAEVDKTEKSV